MNVFFWNAWTVRNQVTTIPLVDLFFICFFVLLLHNRGKIHPGSHHSWRGNFVDKQRRRWSSLLPPAPPFSYESSLCLGPRDQIRAGPNHKLCAGRALTGSPPSSLPGFINLFFLFRMSPRKEHVKVVFPLGMKNMSPDSNTIHITSVDGSKHCQNAMKVLRQPKHYLPVPASSSSVYKKGIRGSWNPPRLLVYTPTTLLLVFTSLSNHESTVRGPACRHIVL